MPFNLTLSTHWIADLVYRAEPTTMTLDRERPVAYAIKNMCPLCKTESRLTMPVDAYHKWIAGQLISDAWPESNLDDREVLKTGYHPHCWNKQFGSLEDDDYT